MTAAPPFFPLPVVFLAILAVPAAAQENPAAQDSVMIQSGAGSANGGRIAINIAAGNQNQQVGDTVIAIGDVAIGTQSVAQFMAAPSPENRATQIDLGANAFSNNSGLLSVNIAAGNQNQSANLALLAVGTAGVVSDQMLAQASAPTKPAGLSAQGPATPNDHIAIDDAAFGNNSGLVQINLVGGERNSSANTFALNVSAGGK